VLATGLATYPDESIICRPFEPDPEDPNTAVNGRFSSPDSPGSEFIAYMGETAT